MPDFQPHSQGTLFTPEEIRVLMAAEFDRSVRFHTPLALLRISVDRLGYLNDLYGEESKFEILAAVNGLLRSSTRASDLLGFPFGNHIIAAVPHIEAQHAKQLAGRLVSGARGLSFDTDGRTLRITASIGLAHSDSSYADFDVMFDAANEALQVATASGGDRFEFLQPKPTAPLPSAAPLAETKEPLEPGDKQLAEMLQRALTSGGPTDLARDMLDRVVKELEQRYRDGASDERTDLLERRVAKLGSMLERTEENLRKVLASNGQDGIASVYRDVQGLDASEVQVEQKRDLLKALFEANLRMRKIQGGDAT